MDAAKLNSAGMDAMRVDADVNKASTPPKVEKQAGFGPPPPPQQQGGGGPADFDAQFVDPQQDAREWGMVAFGIGGALSMFCPDLKAVYTEESCAHWGEAMSKVAQKYGFGGPGNVPELSLALATLSLAVPTVLVVRARVAELQAEAKRAALTAPAPDATAAGAAKPLASVPRAPGLRVGDPPAPGVG